MLLAGISTGHEIGLALVAVVFVGFALVSSFVVPRRHPDYPGRAGMSVFVIVSLVLFASMVTAVELFGGEAEARAGRSHPALAPLQATWHVTETDLLIELPAAAHQLLKPGRYVFAVRNTGHSVHDFSVDGPNLLSGHRTTAPISPGSSVRVSVDLSTGNYQLTSTQPGDRNVGMFDKISVG